MCPNLSIYRRNPVGLTLLTLRMRNYVENKSLRGNRKKTLPDYGKLGGKVPRTRIFFRRGGVSTASRSIWSVLLMQFMIIEKEVVQKREEEDAQHSVGVGKRGIRATKKKDEANGRNARVEKRNRKKSSLVPPRRGGGPLPRLRAVERMSCGSDNGSEASCFFVTKGARTRGKRKRKRKKQQKQAGKKGLRKRVMWKVKVACSSSSRHLMKKMVVC